MQHKNKTIGYAAIQSFFWVCYAAMMGFASMYLLQAGFDNSQVGMLIAAAGLLSALLQPVVAAYADRPGSTPVGKLVICSGTLSLICAALLLFTRGSTLLTGLLYGCCMVLLQLTTPLVNSLGIGAVNCGEKLDFGIARGFGSLGYAAAAYLIGLLANRFGAATVPVCMGLGFFLLLLTVAGFGSTGAKTPPDEKTAPVRGGFLKR